MTAEDPHGPYRAYPALAARGAAPELVADPRIERMLRRLRADPDVNVRRAASWSQVAGESSGYENRMGVDVSKPAIKPALIDPYVADDVMPLPASDRKRRVEVRPGLTVTFVGDGNRGDPVLTVSDRERSLHRRRARRDWRSTFSSQRCAFSISGRMFGTFSLAAAGVGCHVLAVDGSPRNVGLLRSAVTANAFSRMTVAHAIVGDVSGSSRFLSRFAGHVARSNGTDDAEAITVRAATVDEGFSGNAHGTASSS